MSDNQKSFWGYTQAKLMAVAIVVLGGALVYTNMGDSNNEPVELNPTTVAGSMASQMEADEVTDPVDAEPVADEPEKNAETEANKVYDFLVEGPEFPGGIEACAEWIDEHLKYPEECTRENISGRVITSFIVNTDGTISNVEVLRSPSDLMTKEAKRVLQQMPAWTPGKKDGKPVRAIYTLPIKFRLI